MDKLDLSKVSLQSLFTDDPLSPDEPENPQDPKDTQEPADPKEPKEPQNPKDTQDNPGDSTDPVDPADPDEPGDPGDSDEDQDEKTMFQVLQERLGFEIEGEFQEDYDGLVEFTKKTAEKMLEAELGELFTAMPDVAEYMSYRQNGGDPAKFFQKAVTQVDFDTLELKEDDDATNSMVVAELLKKQGFTPEEIRETLEDYKDTGILYKQATKARPKLAKAQVEEKQAVLQAQAQERKQAEEQARKQWEEIQSTINSGVVQGFVIPEADKKSFFEWMAKPVDQSGRTQRHLAREKMSNEQMLAMEYLFYKGFDLNKLVQNTKNTQQANNLRNKLQKSTSGASVRMKSGAQTSARGVKLPGLNELF